MTEKLVEIVFRIPTDITDPEVLWSGLPDGFAFEDRHLLCDDGTILPIWPMRADGQFASIFRSSCRRQPAPEELAIVDRYAINICLSGPGGSLESARRMMRAAAAILHASHSGIFIDNSGLSHGASSWLAMAEDGGVDALGFAYVGIVRGRSGISTFGMHSLGKPDVELPINDVDENGTQVIDLIRTFCQQERIVEDGDWVGDESAPRYQACSMTPAVTNKESVMHNPFGKLRLVRLKDIAERN